MLDESTDVPVHQNLIVYVRFLEQIGSRVVPSVDFLGIRQLSVANAEAISSELIGLLKDKGLDLDRLAGVSTDGASVMVGCKSGVVTRLREMYPGILATHCIAHRLALACGEAADKVTYLVKFQAVLNDLYKYFERSPKNMARLEKVQGILDCSRGTRLKQVSHTRWLSFEGSVQAVVDNYQSVVAVMLEESSAKALALHKPISCYKFLYVAHFLADALKPLAVLSRSYQRSDLDFTEVNCLLHSTVKVLDNLIGNPGGNLSAFLQHAPSEPTLDESGLYTFEFQGHIVRDSLGQRSEAVRACSTFIEGVKASLQSRFTDRGDALVLSALSRFFDPQTVVDRTPPSEDIDIIANHLSVCKVAKVRDCKDELGSFVEFCRAKVDSNSRVGSSSLDICQVAFRARAMFPIVAAAAERLLTAPVSTANCERGFSRQNLIKTD
ncbi:zinc finger protein 862-like, partial [Saccostrea cucullata]|uniref:zinc finger protein 862-like n=1 Tax=Saccostrea cuccullata TaxID=36930 RepID=UPI002ED06E96